MDNLQKGLLIDFFKAVGQPIRIKLLGLLAQQAYSVPELAQLLGQKETAVAKHLRKLQAIGLIHEDSSAFTYTYILDGDGLSQLNEIILENTAKQEA